jgi:hypothetical protein
VGFAISLINTGLCQMVKAFVSKVFGKPGVCLYSTFWMSFSKNVQKNCWRSVIAGYYYKITEAAGAENINDDISTVLKIKAVLILLRFSLFLIDCNISLYLSQKVYFCC